MSRADLSPDFLAILELVLESDQAIEDLAELVSATLAGGTCDERIEALAATVCALEKRAEALDEQVSNLGKVSKSIGAHMKILRTHIATTMRAEGVKTVRGRELTITVRESTPALELLVDEDKIPEEWTRTRVEVDRNAIRSALISGFVLDFAKLRVGDSIAIR
jgi:hypothetical protein